MRKITVFLLVVYVACATTVIASEDITLIAGLGCVTVLTAFIYGIYIEFKRYSVERKINKPD